MTPGAGADGRGLVREVLRGGRAHRLPRAIFGGGLWAYRQAGLAIESLADDPAGFGDRLAGLWAGLDTDVVFVGSGLNTLPAEAIGGEIRFQGARAPLLSFPLIRSAGDARDLERIELDAAPHALALVEMIARVRQRLPDRYLCATSWGPFTWGMILCDWALLEERTVSDPAFVREVCELGVRLSLALFDRLAERGLVDGVCIADGAVTLIADDLYREVVLPCEKRLFDRARAAGAGCFLHQCGKIARQLALYPRTGADCISVDAGVPIGEVCGLYRPGTVAAGNVDAVGVLCGGDPAGVRAAVEACVAGVEDPRAGYILMPSCDLPLETPAANVREFLACADRLGP
jgi:uroporphyrinogen decarboxylase